MPPQRIRPDNGAVYSPSRETLSVGFLSTKFSLIGERLFLKACESIPMWLSAHVGELSILQWESSLSTSNTRTPHSFGAGKSHGDACNIIRASNVPCCHRFSIDERLKS